jgi:putative membrane protein
MGLANLVPGISGGTMLLATGIYELLVNAIADLARLRLRFQVLLVLGCVVGPAVVTIALLSGVAGWFVLEYRWVAYSLFIGLTLGGVPVLMRSIKEVRATTLLGLVLGVLAMAWLAFGTSTGGVSSTSGGWSMLFIAGLAAGAAMILPGLSGSYVLLVLGQYVVILTTIDEARSAVSARDLEALSAAGMTMLPVAVGVVIGIGLVGILIRWLLVRAHSWTMGLLLGLLIGALLGLWPFRVAVPPPVGSVVRGVEVTSVEQSEAIKPKYWPTEGFTPTAEHVGQAMGLVLIGALLSGSIGLLGGSRGAGKSGSPSRSSSQTTT